MEGRLRSALKEESSAVERWVGHEFDLLAIVDSVVRESIGLIHPLYYENAAGAWSSYVRACSYSVSLFISGNLIIGASY